MVRGHRCAGCRAAPVTAEGPEDGAHPSSAPLSHPGPGHSRGAADGRPLPGCAVSPAHPCAPSTAEQHRAAPLGTELRFI